MTKGIPVARHQNLLRASHEAKRALLLTKSWPRTKVHMDTWLRITFALTTRSVNEYMAIIEARTLNDPEVIKALEEAKSKPLPTVDIKPSPHTFVKASDL